MNIAVFVSGNGSNLQALIDAEEKDALDAGTITLVVSDKEEAFALERAKKHNKKIYVVDPKEFKTREEFDKKIIKELKKENIELVVLAGFMRLLSPAFIKAYKDKIINIHPALLPDFKGVNGIKDAFDARVKKTGVTVHFVNNEMDAGPIIAQEVVEIFDEDTLGDLEERIHKVEHKVYPQIVKLVAEGKVKIENEKVIIEE